MPLISSFIIAAELALQNSVDAASALLGTQLTQIVGFATRAVSAPAAGFSMLTGREVATVNGTFRGKTAFAFQIELFAFTPAQSTNRTNILRHRLLSSTLN